MSERVIKDLTEQNRLSSETYWELQTKYEKLESENAALKKQNKKYHEALEYLSDIRNQNLGLSEFSSSEALQELFDIVEKTAEEVL